MGNGIALMLWCVNNDFHIVGWKETITAVRRHALVPAGIDHVHVRDYVIRVKGDFCLVRWKDKAINWKEGKERMHIPAW